MINNLYINPFISYVVSTAIPTPTSIKICKARAMLINPPIEPMRKHEYKPIEVYTCRITLIKSILSRLAFSVFNLPCCCIETPFGSNFYKLYKPKVIQTKPYKATYIKHYKFKNQIIERDLYNLQK